MTSTTVALSVTVIFLSVNFVGFQSEAALVTVTMTTQLCIVHVELMAPHNTMTTEGIDYSKIPCTTQSSLKNKSRFH